MILAILTAALLLAIGAFTFGLAAGMEYVLRINQRVLSDEEG